MPGEIAVGKNAEQFPISIGDHGGAGAHCGHSFQDVANSSIGHYQRQRLARAHDLMHAHQQTAADHSGRMKFGKILFLKSARLEQHHRERVAQRQHYRRA